MKSQPMLRRKRRNKLRIAIRIRSTNAVMHMRDREHQANLRGRLDQGAQQRHRVRSPGDSHGESHARAQKLTINLRYV